MPSAEFSGGSPERREPRWPPLYVPQIRVSTLSVDISHSNDRGATQPSSENDHEPSLSRHVDETPELNEIGRPPPENKEQHHLDLLDEAPTIVPQGDPDAPDALPSGLRLGGAKGFDRPADDSPEASSTDATEETEESNTQPTGVNDAAYSELRHTEVNELDVEDMADEPRVERGPHLLAGRSANDWAAKVETLLGCISGKPGDWQWRSVDGLPTAEEFCEMLRKELAEAEKVDVYHLLDDDNRVVIVVPSELEDKPPAKIFRRIGIRATSELAKVSADAIIGVPVFSLASLPKDLLGAALYAVTLQELRADFGTR